MKKIGFLLACVCLTAGASWAQTSPAADPKLSLATKVVSAQKGPELDRLVEQIANGAAQDLVNKWGAKFENNVAPGQKAKATETLNTELEKFVAEANKIIAAKASQVSSNTLIPAYISRFNQEELQELANFFDSPAVKKYQKLAPELGTEFIQKLVEASRPELLERSKSFETLAEKVIGSDAAQASPKAAKTAKTAKK